MEVSSGGGRAAGVRLVGGCRGPGGRQVEAATGSGQWKGPRGEPPARSWLASPASWPQSTQYKRSFLLLAFGAAAEEEASADVVRPAGGPGGRQAWQWLEAVGGLEASRSSSLCLASSSSQPPGIQRKCGFLLLACGTAATAAKEEAIADGVPSG